MQLEQLPASNPYRGALLRLESLPDSDRATLKAWTDHYPDSGEIEPTLNAEQRALAAELRDTLISAASAPALDSSAWPIIPDPKDPDNPVAIAIHGIGTLRDIARIALKTADALPADEAVATYAAAAQLGRQQRAGSTLIEQLTGVAVEGLAFANASRRIDEYSTEGLRRLSASWAGLHPLPRNAEAFAGERDVFFLPMIDRVIVPGLHALLADPEAGRDRDEDTELGGADEIDPFRDLRFSGLVRVAPGEEQVSLENTATGETLTLHVGRPVEGLELVSIDFEDHRALLRHGEHQALINLRSKHVVALDRAARMLRGMFSDVNALSGENSGEEVLAKTLAHVRAHPGGVEGYARDLLDNYQATIDAQLALADSVNIPTPPTEEPANLDDPFIVAITPVFGRLGRAFNNIATYPTMLQAAVHHRLAELGQAPAAAAPSDPWAEDGAAFGLERTDDGGFILSSRYEVQSGAPLRVKFAAPDAGFVRPPSN